MKIIFRILLLWTVLPVTVWCQSIQLPYVRTSSKPFIWGITGHPLVQQAYNNPGQYQNQLDSVKKLNLSYYRIDIAQDTTNGYVLSSPHLVSLLEKATSSNVKLLPIIGLNLDLNKTSAALYNQGKREGYQFAQQYGTHFDYIEIGNEYDNKTINCACPSGEEKCCPDGNLVNHFDAAKINKAASYLKGLHEGIKLAKSSINTIINAAGWLHFGFFKCLQNEGVSYDVLGYHFYSDMDQPVTDHIIDSLAVFNKPIWFTEFNARPVENADKTVNLPATDAAQADWLPKFMTKLYRDERVKAAFVYELYNEPAFGPTHPESYYGVLSCADANCSTRSYKQSYNATKYKIEELSYGYEDYANALYIDLSCSKPDANGLNYWVNRFKTEDRRSVLSTIIDAAYLDQYIENLYMTTFGHESDHGAGKAYWVDRAKTDLSWEGVIREFCWGSEFWAASGSTNSGFVDNLFYRFLKRYPTTTADMALRNNLIAGLNSTSNKGPAIDSIIHTTEYLSNYVSAQYMLFLNRGRDGDFWVNQMEAGVSQKDLVINFTASDEYWLNSIKQGYVLRRTPNWSANCGTAIYNSSLRLTALEEAVPLVHAFSVYPNPSDGNFVLDYTTGLKTNMVLIHDVMGQVVSQQTIYPGKNQLNMPAIKPGVYVLRIPGIEMSKRLVVK